MSRRRWTEAEDAIVRARYASVGALGTQRALAEHGFERGRDATRKRADALGIRRDPTRRGRWVPLVDVHAVYRSARPNTAHPDAVAAAEADGVLRRGDTYPFPHLVPSGWAADYAARLADRQHVEEVIRRTWLTSAEAGRLFGVKPRTLSTLVCRDYNPGLLGRLVCGIETVTLRVTWAPGKHTTRRYWHPDQTREAARRYWARRSRNPWHLARGEDGGKSCK